MSFDEVLNIDGTLVITDGQKNVRISFDATTSEEELAHLGKMGQAPITERDTKYFDPTNPKRTYLDALKSKMSVAIKPLGEETSYTPANSKYKSIDEAVMKHLGKYYKSNPLESVVYAQQQNEKLNMEALSAHFGMNEKRKNKELLPKLQEKFSDIQNKLATSNDRTEVAKLFNEKQKVSHDLERIKKGLGL